MIVEVLLLTCCVTLAQGNAHEDALGKVLAEGRSKVLQVDDRIRDPKKEYLELIDERKEAIEWEHVVQKENVNRSMTVAVYKGMLRYNRFGTFRCIASEVWPALGKINASANHVQNVTVVMLERALGEVGRVRLITTGLNNYIDELYVRKLKELKNGKDEKERDWILEGAREKMLYLGTILSEVENQAKEIKFKFFEEYIRFAQDMENSLKKIAREAGKKALQCVS